MIAVFRAKAVSAASSVFGRGARGCRPFCPGRGGPPAHPPGHPAAAHSADPGTPRISAIPEDALIVSTDASVENKLFTTGTLGRWNRDGSLLFKGVESEPSHWKKGIHDFDSNYYETCSIRKGLVGLMKRGLRNLPVFFICDNDTTVHLINRTKQCKQVHMRKVVADVKYLKNMLGVEIYGRVPELVEGVHLFSKVRGKEGSDEYNEGVSIAMKEVEKERAVFPLKPQQLYKMVTSRKS